MAVQQDSLSLMVEISKLYYLHGKTQAEIADRFRLSRSMISQLLTKARETGIVEIQYTIHNPLENHDLYASRLEEMFPSVKAIVVPLQNNGKVDTLYPCVERCASVVDEAISSGDLLGISWGSTCYEFMSAYTPSETLRDIAVVPLIGEFNLEKTNMQMNVMVKLLADKLDGTPSYIYAPAITESKEERALYEQSSQLQETVRHWDQLKIAVVTFGILTFGEKNQIDLSGEAIKRYLDDPTLPAGDCCCRRFNIFGEHIRDDFNDRLVCIDVEHLQKIPKVISVCVGKEKVFASYALLKAGFTDTFICDQTMAEDLLRLGEMIEGMK